jgi:hypothetical protein
VQAPDTLKPGAIVAVPSSATPTSNFDWNAGISFAALLVALVALWVSKKNNRITHLQTFVARAVDELVSLSCDAREVQRRYEHLFVGFADRRAKIAARTEFVKSQEAVTDRVEFLSNAFTELQELRVLWDQVVDEEDSHAANDHPTYSGDPNTPRKKTAVITKFVKAASECIVTLRKLS